MICYTLFSGSSGNSIYVREGETEILIDAGVSAKRLEEALRGIGTEMRNISAIYITHEHSDHVKALGILAKNYEIPFYCTLACAKELYLSKLQSGHEAEAAALARHIQTISSGEVYETGAISVTPFHTPHDSRDSVGFVMGDRELGIATDVGHISGEVRRNLSGCRNVILESNYDAGMLFGGSYPPYLKERVASENGHLNNTDCASFVGELAQSGCRSCTLFHLSKENNTPEIAYDTTSGRLLALGAEIGGDICLKVAKREEATEIL